MKFKVGDKVRILDGSKIVDYSCGWADRMKGYVGTVTTISHCLSDNGKPRYCLTDGSGYAWDERGLELVKNEQIIIYSKGDEVIALDKSTNKKGVAKCSPDDEFDFNIGAKLAFERLMNPIKIVKQDKYEVGDKVKIIDKWVDGCCQNISGKMDKWLGKTMTIRSRGYFMEEDKAENDGHGWIWSTNCIEGKVVNECEVKKAVKDKPKFKPGDIVKLVKGYEDIPKGARGTFIKRERDNTIVIDFHVEYKCTHDARCLKTKTGLWLSDADIKKVSE